jgi:transcriptional regulator with XRE-family HTH domain
VTDARGLYTINENILTQLFKALNGFVKMAPHPVDVHVGRRLRSRRTILGMSQEELGEAVGVTFQQIQKYERGLNRIGSSRLYEFACILGVGVSYFFEDFSDEQKSGTATHFAEDGVPFEYERLNNKEVLTLVRAYYGISDRQIRKKVLSLIKSLSSCEDLEEDDSKNDSKKSSGLA